MENDKLMWQIRQVKHRMHYVESFARITYHALKLQKFVIFFGIPFIAS